MADLSAVMEIRKNSLPDAWQESSFKRMFTRHPQEFLVAENGKEAVGYIIGAVKDSSGKINSLAIKPDWRKQGIGENLLRKAIGLIKRKGGKKIFLHVRTWNKEALEFYKNQGFGIIKTTNGHYKNGDDAYLMKKEI